MAYLKFSRDKGGYEHFYLIQPAKRGKVRPRVLYWFRTPPGVKVGRSPFDPEMRRALEAQNPDIVFDWEAITRTPIPPPVESERWRERRRVERAFRAASEIEESASIAGASEQPAQSEIQAAPAIVAPTEEPSAVMVQELSAATEPIAATLTSSTGAATQGGADRQGHRRRRRRRGRRKPQVPGSG